MKGSMKRLMVGTLSATMIIGSTTSVFAATTPEFATLSGPVEGNVIVENNNSKAPDYISVVLPTFADNSFDFAVDPEGLLAKYSADYDKNGTLYFTSTKTAATITAAANKTIYLKSYAVASKADVLAAITVSSSAVSAVKDLYVWVPDTTAADGQGKYLALDKDNYDKYLEATFNTDDSSATALKDVTWKTGNYSLANYDSSADYPFDGNIYKAVYKEQTSALDAATYGTYTAGSNGAAGTWAPDATNVLLYSDEGTTALTASDVEVTDPVTQHSAKSDAITITNKSTYVAAVTAEVEIKNVEGLKFADSAKLGTNDLYLAVTNGTTAKYAALDESDDTKAAASYTVYLAAANNNPLTYQKHTTDSTTKSHDYGQYDSANTTYSSTSIYLTGATGKTDTWASFASSMSDAIELSVTYKIEKVTAPTIAMDNTGKVTISNLNAVQNVTGSETISLTDDKNGTLTLTTKAAKGGYAYSWSTTDDDWKWTATDGGVAVLQLPAAYVTSYTSDNLAVTVSITLTDGTKITNADAPTQFGTAASVNP